MHRIDWKPWVEISIGLTTLAIGAAAVVFSIISLRDDKNARLVEIGVAVLRADPQKEPSAASARKWALDLIDANAGGVKFSTEARKELIDQALTGKFYFEPTHYNEPTFYNNPEVDAQKEKR